MSIVSPYSLLRHEAHYIKDYYEMTNMIKLLLNTNETYRSMNPARLNSKLIYNLFYQYLTRNYSSSSQYKYVDLLWFFPAQFFSKQCYFIDEPSTKNGFYLFGCLSLLRESLKIFNITYYLSNQNTSMSSTIHLWQNLFDGTLYNHDVFEIPHSLSSEICYKGTLELSNNEIDYQQYSTSFYLHIKNHSENHMNVLCNTPIYIVPGQSIFIQSPFYYQNLYQYIYMFHCYYIYELEIISDTLDHYYNSLCTFFHTNAVINDDQELDLDQEMIAESQPIGFIVSCLCSSSITNYNQSISKTGLLLYDKKRFYLCLMNDEHTTIDPHAFYTVFYYNTLLLNVFDSYSIEDEQEAINTIFSEKEEEEVEDIKVVENELQMIVKEMIETIEKQLENQQELSFLSIDDVLESSEVRSLSSLSNYNHEESLSIKKPKTKSIPKNNRKRSNYSIPKIEINQFFEFPSTTVCFNDYRPKPIEEQGISNSQESIVSITKSTSSDLKKTVLNPIYWNNIPIYDTIPETLLKKTNANIIQYSNHLLHMQQSSLHQYLYQYKHHPVYDQKILQQNQIIPVSY